MNKYVYFPTYVYQQEKPEWVDKLRGVFDKYYSNLDKDNGLLVNQTNNMAGDEALCFFEKYLEYTAFMVLQDQGYSVGEYDFYLSAIWGHFIKPFGHHITHIHRESSLCGFYFLDTPDRGAYPVFDDPRPAKISLDLDSQPREEITSATQSIHFDKIKSGTILMTNSWLPHRFEFNQGKSATTFLHFIVSQRKRGV